MLREMGDTESMDGALNGIAVALCRRGEQADVGGASHQHHLAHAECEIAGVGLRHISHDLGEFMARPCRQRLVGDGDFTAQRLQQSEQGTEQGRLAAAVGAQHAQYFAGAQRKTHVAADNVAGIAVAQAIGCEFHAQLRRDATSSQMKKGAPSSAVSTPGGISISTRLRASVSMPSR